MESHDLLFELGSEELPPKSLLKLSDSLKQGIESGLKKADLNYDSAQAYATPRRLAVIIKGLQSVQADKQVEKRGPAIKAAFDADNNPSKAALGFAKSCGVEIGDLGRLNTDKGEWLAFHQQVKGQTVKQLIPDIIRQSIHDLPIAKRMRWGNSDIEFVRPVHWCVLIFGEEVIETTILGLASGSETQGHRFHAPEKINITSPDHYQQTLETQGKVIADFQIRKEKIEALAMQAASSVNGSAHIEPDLLDEVTALNEWPVPVIGHFDERFLALPGEVLITTMQNNQKYFPVKNDSDELLPHFITFSNIESSLPASIKEGNQRVILPRLADAEFFWNQDRKQTLSDRIPQLETIIFQKTLGTLADKTQRLEKISEQIAQQLSADVNQAKKAAQLAKTDLTTHMVNEFASLQGIMGRYYALADGETEAVAHALEQQYFPKQSGSPTPDQIIGQILSLAEKLDTLCGIFSAGLIPSGDKDPYALRRAALGLLRIMIENQLDLDLSQLINSTLSLFKHDFDQNETTRIVTDFIFERLKSYCLEQGYSVNEYHSVYEVRPNQPLDFMLRIQAVKRFSQRPEAESLAAANKRINNILKKSEISADLQVSTLTENQEIALHKTAVKSAEEIEPLLANKDYQAALAILAGLKNPVDEFFEHVMVNVDNPELRCSRLALLSMLSNQFMQIADISKLQ